jgi:sec-independent protein translocase protein TatB
MFDIGWSEILVIAVVAIVVIGPKDLPRALRALGRWTGTMKRMARDFQGQFNEALREAELDDVKKDLQDIARNNPLADIRNEIEKSEAGVKSDLAKTETGIRSDLDKPAVDAVMTKLKADPGTAEPAPLVAGDGKA